MNICLRPSPIREISVNECIGNSLPTFNRNFSLLNEGICFNEQQLSNSTFNYLNFKTNTVTLSGKKNRLMWASVVLTPQQTTTSFEISNFNKINTGEYRINFISSIGINSYGVFGSASITNNSTNLFVTSFNHQTNRVDIIIRDTNYQKIDPDFLSVNIYN